MTKELDLRKATEGDTFKQPITIKEGGSAADISNDDVYWTIKENPDDEEPLAQVVNEGSNGDHSDPANGKTELVIPDSETRGIVNQTRKLHYDILWERSNGEKKTLLIGRKEVIKGVSDVQ